MDLMDRIAALTDDQLRMVAERDDASGVLAEYHLAALRGLPAPERTAVVICDGYAIVAHNGTVERVPMDAMHKIIRREEDGYCVYSHDGSHSFGCYPTMDEAQARLEQIHRFGDGLEKEESFKPPKGVQEAAQRALEWIKDGHAGSGFTDVGRARAAQLARGDNVSRETIGRMASYLARHEVDARATGWNLGEDGFPTPGRVAWDAWGGDAGKRWAESILERTEKACPVATHDVAVNLKNRQTAIEVADYGPLNPAEPNDEYWAHLATYFDTTPEEARTTRCGNCAAFDVTSGMKACIAEGIEGDTQDPYDVIDAGELGYCRVFKFKCASARTCSAWITGGPIQDEAPVSKGRFLRKVDEKMFTLGPLYVPDFMDAHGEWTDSDELQRAVWDWVKGGDRSIYLQHNRTVKAGEWVEVMTMPYEWTVTMKDSSGAPIGKVTYPAGTVFLGVQWDKDAWELVRDGKLRGYSIGGLADREMVELPGDAIREGIISKHGDHDQSSHGNRYGAGGDPIKGPAAAAATSGLTTAEEIEIMLKPSFESPTVTTMPEEAGVFSPTNDDPGLHPDLAGGRYMTADEAEEWGAQHYGDFAEQVSFNGYEQAFANYTDSGYIHINDMLRSEVDLMDEAAVEDFQPIDDSFYGGFGAGGGNAQAAMDAGMVEDMLSSPLMAVPEDVIVSRGTGALPPGTQVGDVLYDGGFMSTSLGHGSAMGGKVETRILVPKGSQGAYVDSVSANPGERELLLQRGTSIKVVSIREGTDRSGMKKTFVDAVVVSQGQRPANAKKSLGKASTQWLALPDKTVFNPDGSIAMLGRKFVADDGDFVLIPAVEKHGDHDQSSHGRGGGGKKPAGSGKKPAGPAAISPNRRYSEMSTEEAIEAITQDVQDLWAGPMMEHDLDVVELNVTDYGEGLYYVTAEFGDAYGRSVSWERTFDTNEGVVEHLLFNIHPGLQGQGIATAVNESAYELYQRRGFDEVQLQANMDVGGYTWAAEGYTWNDDSMDTTEYINGILGNAEFVAGEFGVSDQVAAEIADIDQRMQSGDRPEPIELAMLGRTPGAKTWPGKAAMLGTTWYGRKPL